MPYNGFLSRGLQRTRLLNEIVSAYILKDIRHILSIDKLSELNRLIKNLAHRPDRGELVENIAFMNLLRTSHVTTRIMYWKTKRGSEIDFVVSEDDVLEAYEVKYGASAQNHFRAFTALYPQAKCRIIRYKYEYHEDDLPLWWMQRERIKQ